MDTLTIYQLAVQPRQGELTTSLPRKEVYSGDRAWVVRMVGDSPALDIMRWHYGFPNDRSISGPSYVDLRYVSPGMRDQLCDPQYRCLVPNTVADWGFVENFSPRLGFALTFELETVTPGVWWHEGSDAFFGILAVHDSWGRPESPIVVRATDASDWLTRPIYDAIRSLPIDDELGDRWRPERLALAREQEMRRNDDDVGF